MARWHALILFLAAAVGAAEPVTLRIGFFPNLTHAPALAARQLEREGQAWYASRLPAGVQVEWRAYNAGPSAVEALFAGSIDATFIGPSPLLTGYVRTRGEGLRLLAPIAQGGNALVVRKGLGLKTAADFRGRRIATPQLGNTQDVDARVWLRSGGLRVKTGPGGDVSVLPMANPELVMLFSKGDVDAAWTVEPWVSRLTSEFGGEVLVERPDAFVTVLAASSKSLAQSARRDALVAFTRATLALRDRLVAEPELQLRLVRAGLAAETKSAPPAEALIRSALGRIRLVAPAADAAVRRQGLAEALGQSLRDSVEAGILPATLPVDPLLENLVDDPAR
jgi:NitT/TauT family transport system substrate-binding protein